MSDQSEIKFGKVWVCPCCGSTDDDKVIFKEKDIYIYQSERVFLSTCNNVYVGNCMDLEVMHSNGNVKFSHIEVRDSVIAIKNGKNMIDCKF